MSVFKLMDTKGDLLSNYIKIWENCIPVQCPLSPKNIKFKQNKMVERIYAGNKMDLKQLSLQSFKNKILCSMLHFFMPSSLTLEVNSTWPDIHVTILVRLLWNQVSCSKVCNNIFSYVYCYTWTSSNYRTQFFYSFLSTGQRASSN